MNAVPTGAARCGVLLPAPDASSSERPPAIARAAKLAEQLGFGSLWTGDGLTVAADGGPVDAAACLAAAAAVTERIGLGFAAAIPDPRAPAWTAKHLTAIDAIAGGGRLALGIGIELAEDAGSHSAAEPDAELHHLTGLLTGAPVGDDVPKRTVRVPAIAPALAAVPPIYVGGRDEAARRRAARLGDAWLPAGAAPAEIAEGAAQLAELALEHDRPVPRIAVLVPAAVLDSIDGAVERLSQYTAVGVTEIILGALGDDVLAQYERLAEVHDRLTAASAAGSPR